MKIKKIILSLLLVLAVNSAAFSATMHAILVISTGDKSKLYQSDKSYSGSEEEPEEDGDFTDDPGNSSGDSDSGGFDDGEGFDEEE